MQTAETDREVQCDIQKSAPLGTNRRNSPVADSVVPAKSDKEIGNKKILEFLGLVKNFKIKIVEKMHI